MATYRSNAIGFLCRALSHEHLAILSEDDDAHRASVVSDRIPHLPALEWSAFLILNTLTRLSRLYTHSRELSALLVVRCSMFVVAFDGCVFFSCFFFFFSVRFKQQQKTTALEKRSRAHQRRDREREKETETELQFC